LFKAAQDIVRRSLIFTQKPLEFRNIVESQILSLLSDDEYSLEQVMKFRNVEGMNIFHFCDIITMLRCIGVIDVESFSGTSDEQIRINIAQQEYILTVLKSELEGRDRKKGCRALNLILTLCNESFNF
jgi:hypothetical protein